jgi:hypothetical protein
MRRSFLVLALLFFACATANLLVAVPATNTRGIITTRVANLFGAEAAAEGWPAATPMPWPVVTQWSAERGFAFRECIAWSGPSPDATTHQMVFAEFGWPLPVLDRVQLWWPEDDPKWTTAVPSDSGLRIRWSALTLSSAALALAIWLVLFGPFHLWTAARRWRRRSRGACLQCAYPLRGAPRCPECGWAASNQPS